VSRRTLRLPSIPSHSTPQVQVVLSPPTVGVGFFFTLSQPLGYSPPFGSAL
jgi:hypothetical protein